MSINTAGKRAPLKIGQLTKFKGDASKENDVIAPQSREILQPFVWWGARTCHHQTNVCKIPKLCRAISSLIFNKSLSSLATLLKFLAFCLAELKDFH